MKTNFLHGSRWVSFKLGNFSIHELKETEQNKTIFDIYNTQKVISILSKIAEN